MVIYKQFVIAMAIKILISRPCLYVANCSLQSNPLVASVDNQCVIIMFTIIVVTNVITGSLYSMRHHLIFHICYPMLMLLVQQMKLRISLKLRASHCKCDACNCCYLGHSCPGGWWTNQLQQLLRITLHYLLIMDTAI